MNTLRLFLLSPLGGLVLRWTVLFTLAWLADALMRQGHPRRRLILWRGVLVLGCLLPLSSVVPMRIFRIDGGAALARGLTFANIPAPSAARAASAIPRESSPALSATDGLPAMIPGATLVALVWLFGVVAGAIRLLFLQLRLARLRRNANEPGSELLSLAMDISARLGVRQAVAVRVSNEVTSPLVCGLLHPTIILPEELLRTLAPVQ